MNKQLPTYTTIEVQIEPSLYRAAQISLEQIGSSVEQFAALCILKTVHYMRDIPACANMSPSELSQLVTADVVEELELLYANLSLGDNHK